MDNYNCLHKSNQIFTGIFLLIGYKFILVKKLWKADTYEFQFIEIKKKTLISALEIVL